MSDRYLLGVDIGTSGSTGILVDPELNVVASASRTHEISVPTPGWAEQHPDEVWWREFGEIARELFTESQASPADIAGVGVSSLAPATVPLDASGEPLRPAILYGIDTRSGQEIEHLTERIGTERIVEVCGNGLSYQSVGPKLLWYKRNQPHLFDRTNKILDATGHIVYRLTGEYTIDNGVCAFFGPLYNPSTLEWDTEMCSEVGIDPDVLPQSRWATEVAGTVTESAAEATGLDAGTPVVTGTVDALAAMLSVGAVTEGDSVAVYGTAGVLYTTLDEERQARDLWLGPHCLEGKYAVGGGMAATGGLARWYTEDLGVGATDGNGSVYDQLNREAGTVPPGSDGLMVLPYFSGERTPLHDDSARGTITGLTISHTRAHVYRALLEGTGYGYRHILETMRDANVPVERVFAIGGGATSELWRQVVSDITGLTQQYVANPVGAPLGSAYLAGLGTDVFDGPEPLSESTTIGETTTPDPESESTYDDYYSVYRDLYPSMKEEMHRLASLGSE